MARVWTVAGVVLLPLASVSRARAETPPESTGVHLYRLDQLPVVRDTMPAWVGPRPHGMFCWPPVTENEGIKTLELSPDVVRLSPAAVARRALHRKQLWVVDATWFGLGDSLHAQVLNYAGVDALGNAGRITDATMLRMATYRFSVRASSEAAMRRAVGPRLGGVPPQSVIERLKPQGTPPAR
jgi:hypothetical protein